MRLTYTVQRSAIGKKIGGNGCVSFGLVADCLHVIVIDAKFDVRCGGMGEVQLCKQRVSPVR